MSPPRMIPAGMIPVVADGDPVDVVFHVYADQVRLVGVFRPGHRLPDPPDGAERITVPILFGVQEDSVITVR